MRAAPISILWNILRAALFAAYLLGAGPPAAAQPLSLRSMLTAPDFAEPQLSENGRFLAVLVPVHGHIQLSVIDVDTRTPLTRIAIPGADIGAAQWIGNDRIVFTMDRRGLALTRRFNTGGIFVVNRDGSGQRRLFPTFQDQILSGAKRLVSFSVASIPQGQSDEIIVAGDDRDRNSYDLYRVHVVSGARTHLTAQRPPRTQGWLLGRDGVPRVAVSAPEGTTELVTWWRASPTAPWTELWRSNRVKGDMAVPLHVESDNRHLLVASNAGRETMAVYRYDTQTRERQALLAEHPTRDLGADAAGDPVDDMLLDASGSDVVGFRVDTSPPTTLWLDDLHQRLQALIDGALPGLANTFARAPDGTRTLVASYSDRKPLRWHLLDEQTGRLEALFVSAPWTNNGQLVAMTPFTYTTRDGLQMPSYWFAPHRRKPGERLPTVLLLHGGPWTQPLPWGPGTVLFREAQMLAAQGFAVVIPNFRGTTGLGRTIYQASRGQFGRAMQDDIEDATDWAVAQGLADPARICLAGASYGGYAALMGLVKTPDKYRCAIAGLPVTDLEKLITSGWSDISRNAESRLHWTEMVGDPARDAAALHAVSPARQAHRIRGKVMLYGSVDDRRVPIEQMELMRAALRAQQNEPRWIAAYGEGHGFMGLTNLLDSYTQQFDFLRQNLAPAGAPQAGATTPAAQ